MSATDEKPMFGWGWPSRSKKAHVFSGGRSMCGKWGFFGSVDAITKVMVETHDRGPDDCVECSRKLLAHFGVKRGSPVPPSSTEKP